MPIIFPSHLIGSAIKQLQQRMNGSAPGVKNENLDHAHDPVNQRNKTFKISQAPKTDPKILLESFGFKTTVLKQLLKQDIDDLSSLRYKIKEAVDQLKNRDPHPRQKSNRVEEALNTHFFPANQEGEACEFNIEGIGKLLIDKSKLSVVKRKETRYGEDLFELKMQTEGKLNKEPFEHTVNLVISGFNNEIGQGVDLDICDPRESMSRIFHDSEGK